MHEMAFECLLQCSMGSLQLNTEAKYIAIHKDHGSLMETHLKGTAFLYLLRRSQLPRDLASAFRAFVPAHLTRKTCTLVISSFYRLIHDDCFRNMLHLYIFSGRFSITV